MESISQAMPASYINNSCVIFSEEKRGLDSLLFRIYRMYGFLHILLGLGPSWARIDSWGGMKIMEQEGLNAALKVSQKGKTQSGLIYLW